MTDPRVEQQRLQVKGSRYICRECKNLIGEWRGGSDYCTEVCGVLGRVRAEGERAATQRIADAARTMACAANNNRAAATLIQFANRITAGTLPEGELQTHATEGES